MTIPEGIDLRWFCTFPGSRRGRVSLVVLVGLFSFAIETPAQHTFFARWQAAVAGTPAGVQLRISLPAGQTTWWRGEIIPLQLELASTTSNAWVASSRMYDRSGRLDRMEEFHLDPADDVVDPLNGMGGGLGGGISGGPILLDSKPFAYEREVNEWIRFLRPGAYRLYVTTRRVCRMPEDIAMPQMANCHSGDTAVEIVSNIVTITIRDPPVGWAQDQIDAAVKVLDTPPDSAGAPGEEARRRAGRVLRFLDTPEAAETMLRRLAGPLGTPVSDFRHGVLASPHRERILPLAERLLDDPAQPVTELYIRTLAALHGLVAGGGPMRPYPSDEAAREQWRNESQSRWRRQQEKYDAYYARLAANIKLKQPEARALCLKTLVTRPAQGPDESLPDWHEAAAAQLVENFLALPPEEQRDLLDFYWDRFGGPAMIPVLRALYENPAEPPRDPSIRYLALRRLYTLAPEEARRRILEQLRDPSRTVDWQTLAILEDESLPQLGDSFAARLESGEYVDQLVVRYATSEIADRVKAVYERRLAEMAKREEPPCLNPLHLYLLRHDPAYGEQELRRVLADRRESYPACRDLSAQFRELGRHGMSPALERLAIEYLGDSAVVIKKGAAEILGKFGSAAAEKPLWETMEFFQDWWNGREEQLQQPIGQESLRLEQTLRVALAQGQGWVLDEKKLRRLRELCISDSCRNDVDRWLDAAKTPMPISVDAAGPEYFAAGVGPYRLHSMAGLRAKLAQFPDATVLRWSLRPGDRAPAGRRKVRDEIEEICRASGLVLLAPEIPSAE